MDVRALAQSARRAGLRVTGVDCFSDADCRSACARLVRARGCTADALAQAALDSVSGNVLREGRKGLLVGGGLDARPDLLRRLGQSFRIYGNPPETAELLADPPRLFDLLGRLGIKYPLVLHRPPAERTHWLKKHAASCGGAGVVPAAGEGDSGVGTYFQKLTRGQVVSALFAADGREAVLIGYSRLLSAAIGNRPFSYAGAVAWNGPDLRRRGIIEGWIGALTRAVKLRGVNGIDLILPADESVPPLVLELNARPTATLELHEYRLDGGGVRCHLNACAGRLPRPTSADLIRGTRVVYADRDLVIPDTRWPVWCSDRPVPATRVASGSPVCTVHAAATDSGRVEVLLGQRAAEILSSIQPSGSHTA
jgi:predicted ATP-grasp superfamily ATP-dependent carboligase